MQELKEEKSPDVKKSKSILPLRLLLGNMKKLVVPWLITAAAAVVIVNGTYVVSDFSDRTASVVVNFSFDGIEAGHDPSGSKFDINEIKSKKAIEAAVKELGIEDADVDEIYSSISISGSVPSNVIERITKYTSMYGGEEILTSKNIQDTTYYPTQYHITMSCSKVDMDYGDCIDLLNNITERYEDTFINNYGYKKALENAVLSIDYNDYDYVDAILVFDSSLQSLQDYIDKLAEKDSTRFRSEESGYTFSDLSKSIQTIRDEDLEMISSYITLYNISKDKENLISNYQFRVEEYTRQKKICEEKLAAIKDTLEIYEKNAILIFGNATSGTDATLSRSSDTYDELISQEVEVQKTISDYEQKIEKYNERIKELKNSTKTGSEDTVKEKFEKLNKKVDTLLSAVSTTVGEYYEDAVLANAYEILSPASGSTLGIFINSVKDAFHLAAAAELIIAGIYILVCLAACESHLNSFVTDKYRMLKKAIKNGRKNKKSKGAVK
ncbi:MAG: hypothetical protein ACI4JB_11410 [Porcipelethomonas sp.]